MYQFNGMLISSSPFWDVNAIEYRIQQADYAAWCIANRAIETAILQATFTEMIGF